MSLPELFHHQSRFIGALSVRRVPRLSRGRSAADGPADEVDIRQAEELAARIFFRPSNGDGDVFVFTHAFSYASSPSCPALGADGKCLVHDDRKPTVCSVVPLEALVPDDRQYLVLEERSRDGRTWGTDCIQADAAADLACEERGFTRLTLARRLVDEASRAWLEKRRAELERERRFWGESVFRELAAAWVSPQNRLPRAPEDGDFTLSLVPVLRVVADASPAARSRVVDYLTTQQKLIAATIAAALARRHTRDRAETEQLRTFSRANQALLAQLTERTDPATPRRAEDLHAWLGIPS